MREFLASIFLPVAFLFLTFLPWVIIGFLYSDSSLIAKSKIRATFANFLSKLFNPPRDKRFVTISGMKYGLYCGYFIVDRETKVVYLFCKLAPLVI